MTVTNLHSDITRALIRARRAISKSKFPSIRQVSIENEGTSVVLRGRVSLYYYKQVAQELLRKELDNIAVINRIEVAYRK